MRSRLTMVTAIFFMVTVAASAAQLDVGSGYTYATISAGVAAAGAGDVVMIHTGTYPENITVSSSGTEGSYLTIKAADGEEVIMDGADPVTGWTKCASADDAGGNSNWANIWYAEAPIIPALNINVYEGDDLLALGQYPFPADPFFDRQASEFKDVPSAGYTSTTIRDAAVFPQTEDDYWNGAFVYVYARPNRVYGRIILDYTGSTHEVKYSAVPEGADDSYDKYAVANHPILIDAAGKYAYNQTRKKIWIWPKNTASLENGNIRMSRRSTAFYVSAKPYVKIDGIKFRQYTNTGIYARNGSHGFKVENCEFYRFMSDGRADAIVVNTSDNVLVYRNSIHDNKNGSGMTFNGGTDNIVAENVLRSNGATGITFYGQDGSMLLNNEVYDHIGVHANGLTVYESNVDVLVAGNKVFDGNNALTYQMVTGMTVQNNILHSRGSWAVACWTASNSVNCRFYHNLVINGGGGNAFYSQSGTQSGMVLQNNILTGTFSYTATKSHNIYSGSQSGLNTGEQVVSNLSTLFNNYAGRDYTLATGSAAIDAGTDVGVAGDIASLGRPVGSAPDIGPHEYGGVLDVKENAVPMRDNMAFRLPTPLHREAIPALVKAGFDLDIRLLDGTPVLPENVRGGQVVLIQHEGNVQTVTVIR